jgi:hypothetical protein
LVAAAVVPAFRVQYLMLLSPLVVARVVIREDY